MEARGRGLVIGIGRLRVRGLRTWSLRLKVGVWVWAKLTSAFLLTYWFYLCYYDLCYNCTCANYIL